MVLAVPPGVCTTVEPEASPGVAGALALTVTVACWPGASVTWLGETVPNGTSCCAATCHSTVPVVPLVAGLLVPIGLEITPVQVPAIGCCTVVRPKLLGPSGNVHAAISPRGSIKSMLTLLLPLISQSASRHEAGLPG